MKKTSFLFIILLFATAAFGAADTDSLWIKGNDAYSMGEYDKALEDYSEIEQNGKISARLFYNIGNSYYKLNKTGKSILYYEKALKLDPSGKDIINNLEVAKLKTLDKIDTVPEFVMATWIKDLRNLMSSNNWAYLCLVFFLVTVLLLLLFKFAPNPGQRKVSFIMACLSIFVSVVLFLFSFSLYRNSVSEKYAIVTNSFSNVKSAPSTDGNNIFIIHEGTKVELLDKVGEWKRVELSDGRQGWILSSDIEII
ncbi:MAG: tetratricopeptide repeat protein [Bacteroidales bacterium]|jgi:hypothetical protein|nr:tetratricopeptide repeat protein [Bacteroidales bacterium]